MVRGITADRQHGGRVRCRGWNHGGHGRQPRQLPCLSRRLLERLFLAILPVPRSVRLVVAVMLSHTAVQVGMAAKVVVSKVDRCRHLGEWSTDGEQVWFCQDERPPSSSTRHESGSRVLGRAEIVSRRDTNGGSDLVQTVQLRAAGSRGLARPSSGSPTAIVPMLVEQSPFTAMADVGQWSHAAAGSHLESGTSMLDRHHRGGCVTRGRRG
jgi:hypothetical protein